MVKTTLAANLLLALTALWVIAAHDPQEQAPSAEKLIEQLGSKEFAERERAKRLLQARGPSVLPALRQALADPALDLEVRRRIEQLIPPLEAAAALEPKRVTLKAGKKPLAAVLKEIDRQTGFKVLAGDDEMEFPLHDALDKIPF